MTEFDEVAQVLLPVFKEWLTKYPDSDPNIEVYLFVSEQVDDTTGIQLAVGDALRRIYNKDK